MNVPELRVQLTAHPLVYPALLALGRAAPVVRVPGLGVVVSAVGPAKEVLLDSATFASGGGTSTDLWTPVFGPNMLFNVDGAEHRSMRQRLNEFFAPSYVTQLCKEVLDEPLGRVSDALRAGARVDIVDVTHVLAGALANALIGFPVTGSLAEREAGYRDLVHKGQQITGMVKLGRPKMSDRQVARARAIAEEIGAPAARAWADGDETTPVGRLRAFGLSANETRGLASALLIAGTETVSSLVPRLVALLHDEGALPGVADAYRAGDTGPLDVVVTEALRVLTPAPVILRHATRPATLGSVRVREHDMVIVALTNCTRAYGGFDPDQVRPPELRRLAFGAGPHFCIGYPLAMAETQAILGAVLENAPTRVVRRRAARGVLFPAYRRLEVTRV
jgi:cytochrome P450